MIKSIRLKNFRGIAEGYYEFGLGYNELQGPNEIGKSSIKEAIAFGFYGVDSGGREGPDHLIKQGQPETEVVITTGSASFTRKKRLGKTSSILMERAGFPPYPSMTQTDLTKLLKRDYDVFASSHFVGHFMSLSDAKKLDVLNNVMPVDRENLLKQHVRDPKSIPWKLIKLKKPSVDADAVARERRILQNQLAGQMAAMKELIDSNIQSQATLSDEQLKEAEHAIPSLEAQVSLCHMYQKELSFYETQLARFEVETKNFVLANRQIEQVELRIKALEKPLGYDPGWKIEYDRIVALAKELSNQTEPAPQAPQFQDLPEGSCPRCGQGVPEKLKAEIEAQKSRALIEYNKIAREVMDRNQARKVEEETYWTKASEIKNRVIKLEGDLTNYNIQSDSLRAELVRLGSLQKPVEPIKPEAPAVFSQQQAISEKLSELRGKISIAKLVVAQREGNEKRLEALADQTNKLKALIEPLEEIEKVLKRLPEIEMEMTKERVDLEGVSVMLLEGGLDVRVNDVPYSSLSSGRRIKTDFRWAMKLQSLHPLPHGFYFCDDSDLVDRFDGFIPQNVQVFFARVKPELTELRVVQL